MKFIPLNSTGHGSTGDDPINRFNFLIWEADNVKYEKLAQATVRFPLKGEQDQRPRIEFIWNVYLLYKGVQVYKFHAYRDFLIEETQIPETDTQLRDIIVLSHQALQTAFEERRKEYTAFKSIEGVSEEMIQKIVPLLREVLQNQLIK